MDNLFLGFINNFIDENVLSCLDKMLDLDASVITDPRPDPTAPPQPMTTTTTTTTTKTTTTTILNNACVTYENEKWVSGSIKNSEWQHGSGKGLLFITTCGAIELPLIYFPKKH